MNVAFFLTPKSEVAWIREGSSMRQAIERMNRSGYTAIPILDGEGRYVGTLAEGDLLRKLIATPTLAVADTEHVALADVPLRTDIRAVKIDAEVEELLMRVAEQNFVPVVDDLGVFIGIVRRRSILDHFVRLHS